MLIKIMIVLFLNFVHLIICSKRPFFLSLVPNLLHNLLLVSSYNKILKVVFTLYQFLRFFI